MPPLPDQIQQRPGHLLPSPAVEFNAAATTDISVTALDTTRVVIAYQDGGAGNGQARVGSISGTTITFPGAEADFESVNIPARFISATALDSTRVVIAWEDDQGAGHGQARVASIAGTAISFPSATAEFNAFRSDYNSATALDSTKVLIAYDAAGGSAGRARVGSVAGTVISFPSPEVEFESNSTSYMSAAALSSTQALITYSDDDLVVGKAIVVNIVGTTVSFIPNEVAQFNAASTSFISTTALNGDDVVIAYQDGGNSSFGTAIVAHVESTEITFGTEAVFNNSGATSYTAATALNSNDVVIGYRDSTTFGTAIVGEGDGTVPPPNPLILD